MAKKCKKVYLEEDSWRKLGAKAYEAGYQGRGALSRFLEKVAIEEIAFLDENTKKVLRALPFAVVRPN